MVTKLLGAAHSEKTAEIVIRKLVGLKAGETIALEICPKEATLFEKIIVDEKPYVKGKIFRNIMIRFFAANNADAAIANLKNRTGQRIEKPDRERKIKHYFDSLVFFYKIFAYAKRKNANYIALDSDIARKMLLENIIEARQLSTSVRESGWKRRIMKSKPDYVVIGRGHLDEISSELTRMGCPTTVLYKTRTNLSLTDIILNDIARQAYRRKKMARALKLRKTKQRFL